MPANSISCRPSALTGQRAVETPWESVSHMLRARWFAAVTAALLPVAGFAALLFSAAQSPALAANCAEATDLTVLPSPAGPWTGAPLRVMVVSEKPVDGALSLVAPDGSVAATAPDRRGSEPYFWFAEVAKPAAGKWQATLAASGGCAPVSREITVEARKPAAITAPPGKIWQVRAGWNATTEALFSAWIEKLFDAPPDQDLNWKVWSEVLQDRSRNFLFNYLGRGEDNARSGLRPDCADFVYFLRAYFAYKMGLPFGYSNCSRGTGGRPPKCYQWFDMEHPEFTRPPPPPEQEVASATPAAATPTAPTPTLLRLFAGQPEPADAPPSATPLAPKPKP